MMLTKKILSSVVACLLCGFLITAHDVVLAEEAQAKQPSNNVGVSENDPPLALHLIPKWLVQWR